MSRFCVPHGINLPISISRRSRRSRASPCRSTDSDLSRRLQPRLLGHGAMDDDRSRSAGHLAPADQGPAQIGERGAGVAEILGRRHPGRRGGGLRQEGLGVGRLGGGHVFMGGVSFLFSGGFAEPGRLGLRQRTDLGAPLPELVDRRVDQQLEPRAHGLLRLFNVAADVAAGDVDIDVPGESTSRWRRRSWRANPWHGSSSVTSATRRPPGSTSAAWGGLSTTERPPSYAASTSRNLRKEHPRRKTGRRPKRGRPTWATSDSTGGWCWSSGGWPISRKGASRRPSEAGARPKPPTVFSTTRR